MPALLLPPSVHGVPVAPGPVIYPNGVPIAPGPAIFPDGAFPPVPTATSSAVPEVSGTPASTPTALPPVLGRGYIAPPGVVDSEISRLLSKPVGLSVPTSTLQKRDADADAVAADGGPEKAVTEADLSIPDNQSPLRPIGNEYSHDTFWHLEQPRIRFGYAKRAQRKDKFGNLPGWPIPFSVSFDEYVLKLNEPYAPRKPSTRGKDIPTGGDEYEVVAAKKKVKRGEEMLIVPDIDVPPEKGWSVRKPTAKEPAVKPTFQEQILGLKFLLSNFDESAAAKEGLDEIERVEAYWASNAAKGLPIGSDPEFPYAELEDARLKGWLVKIVDAAVIEHKAALLEGGAWSEAIENVEGLSSEQIAAFWEATTWETVEAGLEWLGLGTAIADGEKADAKLRAIYGGDREAPSKEEAAKEAPKEEEEGHALKPRGFGDPNFSDYRLAQKKKGKLAGTLLQEAQPLEYNFNVKARLDNEEKDIWPFKDGFDDVMYDSRKGQVPGLCVIL